MFSRCIFFFLALFLCALSLCDQGWCNFSEHIEHQWNDLEQVLCKKKSVAIYLADSENDPEFLSILEQAVFEVFGETPKVDLDHKDHESDLTLAIIISRKEEHAYVTLFMAGEDYEREEKPYFLDCFQTPKEKILEEAVIRLRHRIIEISECGGSLKPYLVTYDEDQF